MIRIAGLPVTMLADLRFERSLQAVEETLDSDAGLAAEGRELSALLYDSIGELHAHPLKPALIGLRRATYNGRSRDVARLAERVESLLPAEILARLRRLAMDLELRDRGTRELQHTLSQEIAAKLPALRDFAADPRLRHGLVQSGSGLGEALERWLARPARWRPARPLLFRLVTYLSRIVAKTSPNSTFTTVGLARWVDSGPAMRFRRDVCPCGVLSLDPGLVRELEEALGARHDLRGAFRVRVNPSATPLGASICFLGAPPNEPIVAVAVTPEVTACLELAGEVGCGTLHDLRQRLAATADGSAAAERSRRYLDRLIEVGLLELHLGVPDQSEDPLAEIALHLEAAEGGQYHDIARLCRDLGAEILTPTVPEEVGEHRRRLAAVESRIGYLDKALGLRSEGSTGARFGAVQENVVFPRPVVECSRSSWRAATDDLDVIRRWMGLHDPQLPLRLALGSYFRQRFGAAARVPFLHFHQALEKDLRVEGSRDAEPASVAEVRRLYRVWGPPPERRLPRLVELDRLRRQSVRQVVDRLPGGDGVVRVEPALLIEALDRCPAYVTAPSSAACYVQPVMRAGELRLVLNAMISGYGRGRGRWLHLVRRAARASGVEAPSDGLAAVVDEPGVVFAESRGAFGTALNLRPPVALHEIDYPYVVGDGETRRRIALRDLVVAHHRRSDSIRLYCDRRRTQVRPVHAGMMVEFLLPPALRLLVRGFSSPTLHYPAIPFLLRGAASRGEAVIALPRVDVGRVTLRRASWLVPSQSVPRRRKGQIDADYLLMVHRWLRSERIPLRCFVRSMRASSAAGLELSRGKWRKPLFIDFANWFLLTVFERMTRPGAGADDELMVFEEALPAPEDALAPGPSQCELIVEITSDADA